MAQKIFTTDFIIKHLKPKLKSEDTKKIVNAYRKDFWEYPDIMPQNSIISVDYKPYNKEITDRMISQFKLRDSIPDKDFFSGKELYQSLRDITLKQASDYRFWNYLNHFDAFKYIRLRWPNIDNPPNNSTPENYIINHWIQTSYAQSEQMDYPLSGLWWSFYISEDCTRENPYELTEVLFQNFNFRTKTFGQSKAARHKECTIGVLEFIKENELHLKNFEDNGKAIAAYINLLGGLKPLSYFDRNWFKDQLLIGFSSDLEKYGRLFRRDERPD